MTNRISFRYAQRAFLAAVAAVALAIAGSQMAQAGYQSTDWLSSNGIQTLDGCGVYSTMTSSRADASENWSCPGQVQVSIRVTNGLSYDIVVGAFNNSASSATRPNWFWPVVNYKSTHRS